VPEEAALVHPFVWEAVTAYPKVPVEEGVPLMVYTAPLAEPVMPEGKLPLLLLMLVASFPVYVIVVIAEP
jgi:hypothetical protein